MVKKLGIYNKYKFCKQKVALRFQINTKTNKTSASIKKSLTLGK